MLDEAVSTLFSSPLAVAGAGLTIGVIFGLCARGRTLGARARQQARLLDIAAELEHILPRLRDDEHVPADAASAGVEDDETSELAERAHHLLSEREQLRRTLAEKTTSDLPPKKTQRFFLGPQLKGALWGGLSVGTFGLLLVSLNNNSQTRVERAPVDLAETEAPIASQPIGAAAVGQEDNRAEFRAIQARLEEAPNDIPTLLRLAHLLLRNQLLEEAQTVNDRVLALSPNDLEALTHAAVLAAGSGHPERATAGLSAVLKKDPQFAEAWFFRGMLAMQRGDMTTTRESFSQYVAVAPPGAQRDRIASMLGQMNAS